MAEIIMSNAIGKLIVIILKLISIKKNREKIWAINVWGSRIKIKSFKENMIFFDFKKTNSWFNDLNEWIKIKYKVKDIKIGKRKNVKMIKPKWKTSDVKSWSVIILFVNK